MGTQGGKPEQKACRGSLIGSISLAGASVNTYMTQNHLPMGGSVHSGLGLRTSINNKENVPTDVPTGQSG